MNRSRPAKGCPKLTCVVSVKVNFSGSEFVFALDPLKFGVPLTEALKLELKVFNQLVALVVF